MGVKVTSSNGVMIAYLSGDIDHHNAKCMREIIDEAVTRQKPEELILDFRNVTFMDSSGIGLVMGRYRLLQITKSSLKVANVSKQTQKVMRLAGLDKLAKITVKGEDEE